jgi:hypothetical protein
VKGLRYDLEYLGQMDSWLAPKIAQLQHWINGWFEDTPSDKVISEYFKDFLKHYSAFTEKLLEKSPIYLPNLPHYSIAKNIELVNGDKVTSTRNGILLPAISSRLLGLKYPKAQNKLNAFRFSAPITIQSPNSILEKRFQLLSDVKKYNSEYLSNLTTLTSGLILKIL